MSSSRIIGGLMPQTVDPHPNFKKLNMNASKTPIVGPGRFQWNAGAWFGSSLGSSAWMLVTACFLLVSGQVILASIPITGFTLVLIGSTLLWSRRHSIFPFSALMTLMGLLAIAFPLVWCAVQSFGSPSALTAMNWPESRWATILVFAVAPAGMIWSFILEKTYKPWNAPGNPDSNAVA